MIGQTLGDKYEVLEELGPGPLGVVYRALHRGLNREVALKVFREDLSGNTEFTDWLLHEAEQARKLEHPNICRVIEAAALDGHTLIASELIEGESLRAKLDGQGQLTADQAVAIVRDTARALEYAHGLDIYHGNIHPGNIFVDNEGQALLTDIGVGRAVAAGGGDPEYDQRQKPYQQPGDEQANDPAADLYALGTVLFEALVGRQPQRDGASSEPAGQARPDLPPALAQTVDRCLSPDAEERFPDAFSLIWALVEAGEGGEGDTGATADLGSYAEKEEEEEEEEAPEPEPSEPEKPAAPTPAAAAPGEKKGDEDLDIEAELDAAIKALEDSFTDEGGKQQAGAKAAPAAPPPPPAAPAEEEAPAPTMAAGKSPPTAEFEGWPSMGEDEEPEAPPRAQAATQPVETPAGPPTEFPGWPGEEPEKPAPPAGAMATKPLAGLAEVPPPPPPEPRELPALDLPTVPRRRRQFSGKLIIGGVGLAIIGVGALVLLFLMSNVGNLNLTSTPSGADIFMDGEQVHDRDGAPAKTPYRLRGIKAGLHDIELRLANHAKWAKQVDVARDQDTPVNAILDPFLCTLHISTNIPDARVLIDQEPRGQCNDGHLTIDNLPYGSYLVGVEHPRGWCTERTEAFTANQAKAALTINLEPKKGTLDINADQRGARVTIDGRPAGTVPLRRLLNYGQYRVEIVAPGPGFAAFDEVIPVDRPEVPINAVLLEIHGRLIVTSEPTGAAVFLGEQELGLTPVDQQVPVGQQVLRVNFPMHREERREITIRQDAPTEMHFALSPEPASLVVETIPPGLAATVFINGEEQGPTPLRRTGMPAGPIRIRVIKEGYVPWEETRRLENGRVVRVEVPMTPVTGVIEINSDPHGARVWVNGRPYGETPTTIEGLEPGFHQVELDLRNHRVFSEEVEVRANRVSPLNVRLTPYCASLRVNTNPPDQVARYRIMSRMKMTDYPGGVGALDEGEVVRRWTPFVVNDVPYDQVVYIRLEIFHEGQAYVNEGFVRFELGRETVISWDIINNPQSQWQIQYH